MSELTAGLLAVTDPASAGGWIRIVAHRRRDRLVILPLTFLAALASAYWLGAQFAVIWLAACLVSFTISHLLGERIARMAAPSSGWHGLLAVQGGVHTIVYCAMPLALGLDGSQTATITSLAMFGAIAMSASAEFVISRPIGAAALAADCAMVAVAVFWRTTAHGLGMVYAVTGIVCFFGYVFQAARIRRSMEERIAVALETAVIKEREAAVANAAKSTFLATMSHEIRTPLNGVLGMAQAMEADTLSDEQRARLAVIRKSGEALTAVLNDVLDLSKIEAGQLEVETIVFDLAEVLRMGRAAFAINAEAKGLSLELEIDETACGAYLGDPTRLRQVVYNLVSNAVKFTSRGGIVVRAWREDGMLCISVTDTGDGIAQDQQQRLFAKFVQLDASTTRRYGGSGLGLAICRELCALMGGEIAVDSTVGQGSTFVVRLPLNRAEQTSAAAAGAPRPELTASPEDRAIRILAAEDNEVNRLVLKTLLAQAGLDLTMVTDGAQAVTAWETGEWDLVLMDVQMPVMDGLTAVKEIRARERASGRTRTPVIALTGDAMAHQVAELSAAGMDDHVAKPIEVARLFGAIEAALSEESLIRSN